jgi:hypothetical protein
MATMKPKDDFGHEESRGLAGLKADQAELSVIGLWTRFRLKRDERYEKRGS